MLKEAVAGAAAGAMTEVGEEQELGHDLLVCEVLQLLQDAAEVFTALERC